jgi:glycosyltransferase involved in cell wall biosynthesis
MKRPVVLLLGPHREAVSGVSTHLNLLFASRLAGEFSLAHFQVGSEGRTEGRLGLLVRLLVSPISLALAILMRGVAVVHFNTALTARAYWRDLVYLIVAKICGTRVIYQMHGGALPQQFFGRSRALTGFLRGTLLLPDAVVVLARSELEAYRSFVPGQQVLVVPNGIDCAEYAEFARVRSDATAPLKLVYIGRLAKEKGLYEVLRGLELARARGTRARIVLAGSGPEEGRLRQCADELGLGRDVTLIGPVFGKNKTRLLGGADVLVLASYSEGLPYALLESMAAGAPVITTRVGAIPDVVIEGVHGLFVPLCDPEAVGRAIARLASDRDLLARMSAACRRRIAGGYSTERLSDEFHRLYCELCAAKRIKALTRS